MIVYDQNLKIFYSNKINDRTFFSGFSTVSLGDARNISNILAFFTKQNISFQNIVTLEQIHSTNIEVINETDIKKTFINIEDTDAVITQSRHIIAIVRNADCVPIIYLDKKIGLLGISHQGWRGSLKNMAAKMVQKMQSLGSRKENIIVALGPAINDCCYDVDEDRFYAFREEFDKFTNQIFHLSKGKRYLNLTRLNYLELMDAGVKKENIDYSPFCTKCNWRYFFSRRRSGNSNFPEMFNFILKN